jgi:iron complex outermembrane receptor protein
VVEFAPGSSIGSFAIRNAGELVSQGFELELLARPVSGLSLGFGLAYTDAEFASFTSASCPRLGAVVTTVGAPCGPRVAGGPNATSFDASGLAVNNAPELTGNVSAGYDFIVSESSGIGGFLQALYYFRSDNFFGLYPANIPNPTMQDGFGILNATAGITFNDERITLAIWGRNLFDRNFVTSIFDTPFDGAGGLAQFLTRDADRTLGVRVGINF